MLYMKDVENVRVSSEKNWYGKIPNCAVTDNYPLRLVLKTKHVPEGCNVTKVKGTKPYTLHRRAPVQFLHDNGDGTLSAGKPQYVENPGGAFLKDGENNYTLISGDTDLVVEMSVEQLENFLTAISSGIPQ